MANRYWVGGTATWDGTAGTKWATTSGGAGGAAVPTAADDVFFDAASGAVTITTSGTTTDLCRSLDCTGFTGTLSHASATTIVIGDGTAGIFKLVAGMTYTKGSTTTSRLSFVSTTTGNNITTAGKVLGNVTFDGAGGGWVLQDSYTANGSASTSITLTAGTLDTNGQTVTVGSFASNNSNTRTLTLGASTINVSSTGTAWSFATTTNLTFNVGTSTINLTGVGTLSGGGLTYNTVVFSGGSGTSTINQENTFGTLTVTGSAAKTDDFRLNANQTITGTLTLTGNSATNRLFTLSGTVGTAYTLTAATVSLTNVDFQDITAAGAAAPFTGTSLGNALGNSNITFTAAVTRYFVYTNGLWSLTANWSASSGGATGASVPLCHDTVLIDANSFTAGGLSMTMDIPRLAASVDFTGTANTPTIQFTSLRTVIYGSLTLVAGLSYSGTQVTDFYGRGSHTLTTGGLTITNQWNFEAFGGTYTLQDDMTRSSSFTWQKGTFDANDKNITSSSGFTSSNSDSRVINMGNGTWTFTGTGTVWNTGTTTNLTLNAESSVLVISNTSATSKTLTGGGRTFSTLTITGDNVIISGANTFATLNVNNAALTNGLKLTSGTTQTITSTFTTNGSAGNLAKIVSTTGGSAATLSKAAGIVSEDYMSLQDSTATGGASWYAGAGSTNVSNNSGWIFTDPPTAIWAVENVTVTENTVVALSAPQVNTSDSITVTESISAVQSNDINTSDSITVTESVSVLLPELYVSVSDSATITESTTALVPALPVGLSDSVSITENIVVYTLTPFGTNSNESVTVSEALSVVLSDPQVSVSDSIVITESHSELLSVTVNVSDSITATENTGATTAYNISTSDTITLSESRILQRLRGSKYRTSYSRTGKPTTPYSKTSKPTTPYDR